jgi:hypothetical protein
LAAEFFEYKLLLDLADSIGSDAQNIEIGPDEHGINRMAISIRRRMLPPAIGKCLGTAFSSGSKAIGCHSCRSRASSGNAVASVCPRVPKWC